MTVRFHADFRLHGVELESSTRKAGRVPSAQPLPIAAANGAHDAAALGAWLDHVLTTGGMIGLAGAGKRWIRLEGDVWEPEVAAVFGRPWTHIRFEDKHLLLDGDLDIALTCRPSGAKPREARIFDRPGRLLLLGDDDAHLEKIHALARPLGWGRQIGTTVDNARRLLGEGGWSIIYCAGRRGEGLPDNHDPLLRLGDDVLSVADHIGGEELPTLVVFNVPGTGLRGVALRRFLERADVAIGHQDHLNTAHQAEWGYELMLRILDGREHPAIAARDAARCLSGQALSPLVWERCAGWDAGARVHYTGPNCSRGDILGHALQLDREEQWRHLCSLKRKRSAVVLGYGDKRQSVHRFFERLERELDLGTTPMRVDYNEIGANVSGANLLQLIAPRFVGEPTPASEAIRNALRYRRLDVLLGHKGTLEVHADGPTPETEATVHALEALFAGEELADAVNSDAPHPLRLYVMLEYSTGNRRAFRTVRNTSGYVGGVGNSIFHALRSWYLSICDTGRPSRAAAELIKRIRGAVVTGPSASTFEVVQLPEFHLPNEEHVDTFLTYIAASKAEREALKKLRTRLEADPAYTFEHLVLDIEKELGT